MAQPVRAGLIGAGFSADFHAESYRRIADIDVQLVAVADTVRENGEALARKYNVPQVYTDAAALLAREDINLVDICVPNRLHERFCLAAAEAGKNFVCEKPLTGYYGGPGAATPVGTTPKALMMREAVASAERIVRTAREHGVKLMYAENWLYSPVVLRAARLAEASGGTILEIRAQECHSGSHAGYAKSWQAAGGGALVRLASHPLGTALWLKAEEGLRRDGRPITLESVVAEVGDLSKVASFRKETAHFVVDDWQDVENWSSTVLNFSDGTRAVILASDIILGGMEDSMQLMLSNCRIDCDMTHNGLVKAFAPNAEVFANEYIMEKLSTSAGWSYPAVDERYLLGYPQEIRDFVECVAYDRQPRSGGELGYRVVEALYAAYVSAEEGRRVVLNQ